MTLFAGKAGSVLAAWLCAGGAVAISGCGLHGGPGRLGGPGPNMQFSGSPELAGTASLPAGVVHGGAAMATALVLQAFRWPVVSVDTTQGELVSDWQYFEPALRRSAGQGYFCQNPMALRFTVRSLSPQWVRIAAEAYLPRPASGGGWVDAAVRSEDESLRRDALDQARATLASLRKVLLASDGAEDAEVRAIDEFAKRLDAGGYARCAGRS